MPPYTRARKEHRKQPFLKVLARVGTIAGAAKASRISRDAVYDWRRTDPAFEQAFQNAKHRHVDQAFEIVDSTIVFIKDVVRPVIPSNLWPKVSAEIVIASINLKRDLKDGGPRQSPAHRAIHSGKLADVSLSPNRPLPIRLEDVAIPDCDSGTSAAV